MHEDVGLPHELQQYRKALGLLQVEHEAALAAVHAEEGAALGLERRRVLAQRVAAGRLDLGDFRAKVGEQRAAVGPGDIAAEIEDLDPGERALRYC